MKFFLLLSASLAIVAQAVITIIQNEDPCQKYGPYSAGCIKNFLSQPQIPPKAELDKHASDTNTSEILKILDHVSNLGNPCEVKLTYLHEVMGSVKEVLN